MSTAQHTLGPWWVTASGVRDRGGYICHTNPAQRYEGQDERFAQETAERAANKLLIAAAPDLLAALREVLTHEKWHAASADEVTPEARAAIKQADAAIAKATGRAA